MSAGSGELRVLHVAQPPHGGVAEHIRAIAVESLRLGQRPEVAVSADNRAIAALEQAGIPVHRVDLRPGIIPPRRSDPAATRALRQVIRERDIAVVHAHGAKAGIIGRLAAASLRVPAVYTAHGWAFNEYPFRNPPPSLAHRAATVGLERLFARLARFIVCVSEAEAEAARLHHVPDDGRYRVVHHGVSVNSSAVPSPEMLAWKGGGPLLGSVAVFRPEKGHHVLLDAIAEARQAVGEARFALVGEGDERAALERQIARLELGDLVRIFDYSGAVDTHLAALDGFILPSHQFEAAGIGVLEAMAFGLPVIASRLGGVPESVGEAGILVEPGSVADLASAIIRLAGDAELRSRLGEAARQRIADGFTLAHEARSLDAIYREAER